MRLHKLSLGFTAMLSMLAATPFITGTRAIAQTEKVLYNFGSSSTDGIEPEGGLIFDSAGNLYGTTAYGGSGTCILDSEIPGCGTVYELVPQTGGTWTETILHSFQNNGKDGEEPSRSSLLFDSAGNLYGLTPEGGASTDCPGGDGGTNGCGTAYELVKATGWTSRVLHSFDGNNKGTDGQNPVGSPVFDTAGNLYGATIGQGTDGCGMAFKLSPEAPPATWYERTMYNFQNNGKDACEPYGGLIFDSAGNLYGVSWYGGKYGDGTVYELIPTATGWRDEILYSFGNGTDASHPTGGLIFDGSGNLYGVAAEGGANSLGGVFELSPATGGTWTEKVIHSFAKNGTDGWLPNGTLIIDSSGNLYGTAQFGGPLDECGSDAGCGVVYELSPPPSGETTWTETILHSFVNNETDGLFPYSSLILDSAGNLYGVTQFGGANDEGAVYEVTP
jgi:uncharacterized repeat protein (TIGR03803 family)